MQRTEQRNPNTMHIDTASTAEIMQMIQNENYNAVKAVGEAIPAITRACDSITEGLKAGGRLIYIGAGTSGRLGILDAVECPPTYGVSPELVSGIIAGGEKCLTQASEGAEDSAEAGVRDIAAKNLIPADRVVGISAAGNAAYVAEALKYARSVGCVTIGITNNAGSRLDVESDISILVDTGAEVITGSTRMKAGTSQKLILNMMSTCAMIQAGNVMENLMINLRPTNRKLRARMIRIVSDVCGVTEARAEVLLEENGFEIRRAVEAEKKARNAT